MSERPHFQQAVYDEGYAAGRRAGFYSGELYGRGLQKMQDEFKPLVGFALGILTSTVVVLALHAFGAIRW